MYAFSKDAPKNGLFASVPKSVVLETPKTWLHRLFSSPENTASYLLQKELFTYLQTTHLIGLEFPFMHNNPRFIQNSMVAHVCLLKLRMKRESELPKSELQQNFGYCLQTYFYPEFAQFANPAIPVTNFRDHYAEAYTRKAENYEEQLSELEWTINPNRQEVPAEAYGGLFRKLIFENRVGLDSLELLKFCKYYAAHKKYLGMLRWDEMLQFKIKWGFESLRYIGEMGQ